MDFEKLLKDNPKRLDLSFKNIDNEQIKNLFIMLEKNNSLKRLYLSGNCIRDEEIKFMSSVLKKNNSLKILDLSINKLSDKGINDIVRALEKNTSLEYLDLWNNFTVNEDISTTVAHALENNYSLTRLCIDNKTKELTDLLKRNRKYQSEIKPKVKNLLLLVRTFDQASFFHQDYLPLDIFKIIFNSF